MFAYACAVPKQVLPIQINGFTNVGERFLVAALDGLKPFFMHFHPGLWTSVRIQNLNPPFRDASGRERTLKHGNSNRQP